MSRHLQKKGLVSASIKDIVWLPDLYSLSRTAKGNYQIRVSKCGHTPGYYYEQHGILFKADGTAGKLSDLKPRSVPVTNRSPTPAEASETYTRQEWESKQRIDQYFEMKKPTVKKLLAKREESGIINPSLCKNIKACNENIIECTKNNYWFAQDKVDGERIIVFLPKSGPPLADATANDIKIASRTCQEKNFRMAIRKDCLKLLHKVTKWFPKFNIIGFDGELCMPGTVLQDVRSRAARTVNIHKDDDKMLLYLFDLVIYDVKFKTRDKIRYELKPYIEKRKNIHFVETRKFTDWDSIKAFYNECLENGGKEGMVLRRSSHCYPRDKNVRHNDMLKMKKVDHSEYEVIGYDECEGTHKGCVKWELRDPVNSEITLSCSQNGPIEYQQELYKNGDDYIGKYITIEHIGYTKDGKPNCPKALYFRSIDDLPSTYKPKFDEDSDSSEEKPKNKKDAMKQAVNKNADNSEYDFGCIKGYKTSFACSVSGSNEDDAKPVKKEVKKEVRKKIK